MKAITQQWLNFAKADLMTCESTLQNKFLTHIVTFHAQQAVEKCFKAIIEEKGENLPRIHDLTRLYNYVSEDINFNVDRVLLNMLDSVYTTSRYPGDIGLTPDGKPSTEEAMQLYEFAKYVFEKAVQMMKST